MPPKRLRRRLKLFWPSKKIIVGLITTTAAFFLVAGFVVVKSINSTAKSSSPILSATTTLSADDWQFSQVLVFLKEHGLTVTEPTLSSGTMQFKIGQAVIVLPLGAGLQEKLDTFWKVWKQYQILGKALKKIDLRFSYPLVTY